jgi:hypothetical protein
MIVLVRPTAPVYSETQQQLDLIREKHADLIKTFLEGIQDKSQSTQESLCYQMNKLGEHIRDVYRRFPANSDKGNIELLKKEIKWIDGRASLILKSLQESKYYYKAPGQTMGFPFQPQIGGPRREGHDNFI